MSSQNKDRVLFLDVLRGVAAFSVVLFHYSRDFYPVFFRFPLNFGYMGVPLFFMISGFVIFMTLEKTTSPKQFIISRFSRLFPGYWFIVLLTFGIVMILGKSTEQRTIFDLAINLTMLQHWFLVQPIDGAYWTLTVELSFYFLMLILFIFKQLDKIYFWASLFVIGMFISKYLNVHFDLPVYYLLPLLHWGNLFFAGIIFYKIFSIGGKTIDFLLLSATLLTQFLINNNLTENIIVAFFYLLFYILIIIKFDWARLKIFIFLGTISYSLYLVHQLNGAILFNHLSFLPPLLGALVILCFMIIMSCISTFLIEKPAQKFIRNRLK